MQSPIPPLPVGAWLYRAQAVAMLLPMRLGKCLVLRARHRAWRRQGCRLAKRRWSRLMPSRRLTIHSIELAERGSAIHEPRAHALPVSVDARPPGPSEARTRGPGKTIVPRPSTCALEHIRGDDVLRSVGEQRGAHRLGGF